MKGVLLFLLFLNFAFSSDLMCTALSKFNADYAIKRGKSIVDKMIELKCQRHFFWIYSESLIQASCKFGWWWIQCETCDFKFSEIQKCQEQIKNLKD